LKSLFSNSLGESLSTIMNTISPLNSLGVQIGSGITKRESSNSSIITKTPGDSISIMSERISNKFYSMLKESSKNTKYKEDTEKKYYQKQIVKNNKESNKNTPKNIPSIYRPNVTQPRPSSMASRKPGSKPFVPQELIDDTGIIDRVISSLLNYQTYIKL